MRKIPQNNTSIINTKITLNCGSIITPLERVNSDYYIVECSTCSLDNTLWPYGSIVIRRDHLMNGHTACGCGHSPRWTLEQMTIRVERLLSSKGHSLLKITKKSPFSRSIATCKCDLHGLWDTRIINLISKGSGCQTCGGGMRRSEEDAIRAVKTTCSNKGYSFISFPLGYVNKNSELIISCDDHGEWSTTFNNFVNNNRCCQGCSISGYRNNIKGYLYHLKSESGHFSKIGITNNIKSRMYRLKSATPFVFDLIGMVEFKDGGEARIIEKALHDCFVNANLQGFDGCTEWFNSDPSIDYWFKLL